MKFIDWNSIIDAYNSGMTADMLQAEFDGEQGTRTRGAAILPLPRATNSAHKAGGIASAGSTGSSRCHRYGTAFLQTASAGPRHFRRSHLASISF